MAIISSANPVSNLDECVVTGVAGFVGSHLAEHLLSMGFTVIGVDNFSSGKRENLASFEDHASFTFYQVDIREPSLLERLKRAHPEINRVFHLAAVVSVPYSIDHPEETMQVNYEATRCLLREADRLCLGAFVFAGSAAEYGDDPRIPLKEHYAAESTHHLSPYGRGKYFASRDVAANHRGVALRFFNIYGPRQDPGSPYSGVISRFVDMVRDGRDLTIFGDGLQTRDFIYISDVVEAYILASGLKGRNAVLQGVYNIGTGKGTSILELAGVIGQLGGAVANPRFLPERPGDIRNSIAAIGKFQRATGWSAGVSLYDGLKDTMKSSAVPVYGEL